MKHFTIENETNNITVHSSVKEAEAIPNSQRFSSEGALAKLSVDWPVSRLVEVWNSLPGVNPVSKFKDRATGVSRIWKAIQSLAENEGEPTEIVVAGDGCAAPDLLAEVVVAPGEQAGAEAYQPGTPELATTEPAVDTDAGTQAPDVAPASPASKKKATRAKKVDTAQTGTPREGSKASQVIAMLKRPEGTTVEEIMAAMKWLKHTTRALLSAGGSITKNHGLTVTSEKVGDTRRYYIKG